MSSMSSRIATHWFAGAWRVTALAAAVVVLGALPGQAATFVVNSSTDAHDASPGNGVCATGVGSCGVRAAIEEANAYAGYDTVAIGAGTYYIGDPLEVNSSMSINGAGATSTHLNGGGLGRVFEIGETQTAQVMIRNVHITMGMEVGSGGLILIFSNSNVTLEGSLVNVGGAGFGGCISTDGDLTLNFTVINGCTATVAGGGLLLDSSEATVTVGVGSVIEGNDAVYGGGGAFVGSGLLILESAYVTANTADAASGLGGGLYVSTGSVVEVRQSTLDGNSAWDGGGIYQESGVLTIEESTLAGNYAYRHGGGLMIANSSDHGWVVNSTFSGNYANRHGGAVYWDTPTAYRLYLNSSTISDNTADDDGNDDGNGGGVYQGNASAKISLTNTIVAGNIDASVGTFALYAPDCAGALQSEGYNIFGKVNNLCTIIGDTTGNQTGTLASPVDPGIGPMNSGCWGGDAHPLLNGSPAVDAGDPAGCLYPDGSPIYVDQCWEDRQFGPRCDIGAVESSWTGDLIFRDGFESGGTSAWGVTIG